MKKLLRSLGAESMCSFPLPPQPPPSILSYPILWEIKSFNPTWKNPRFINDRQWPVISQSNLSWFWLPPLQVQRNSYIYFWATLFSAAIHVCVYVNDWWAILNILKFNWWPFRKVSFQPFYNFNISAQAHFSRFPPFCSLHRSRHSTSSLG